MNLFATHYAVVQYSPHLQRRESLNIGVITFSPGTGEIALRIGGFRQRLARAFASYQLEEEVVEQEIESIQGWIDASRGHITERTFMSFLQETEGRIVRITHAGTMRCEDATQAAADLTHKLVNQSILTAHSSYWEKVERYRLDFLSRVRNLANEGRIAPNRMVRIPGYSRSMRTDLFYRNGCDEWVVIQGFSGAVGRIRDEAAKLAYRGRSLFRKTDGSNRLIYICLFRDASIREHVEKDVIELFREEDCEGITEAGADDFVARIAREAKSLPAQIEPPALVPS